MMRKKILRIAIPSILANIAIVMPGIADAVILGHQQSEIYLAGVALAGVIFNYLIWGMGFLRMSTIGLTSQSIGQRDEKETLAWLYRGFSVALIFGVSFVLLSYPIKSLSWLFLNNPDQGVMAQAEIYFDIRILSMPSVFINMVISAWLISNQKIRLSFLLILIENSVNIALNCIFVLIYSMNTDGVAFATVFSSWFACFLGLGALQYYFEIFNSFIKKITNSFNRAPWKRFFQLNLNIFIRTLCLIFVFSWFTIQSSHEGREILAVNSLLMQFFTFFSFFMDGIANAAETLVGQYLGASKIRNLNFLIRIIFRMGLGVALFFSAIYLFLGRMILSGLTSNRVLIEIADSFLWFPVFIPLLGFSAFIWDGVFVGATMGKEMRNAMIINVFVLFIPIYFILHFLWPIYAIWISFLFFLLGRTLLMWIYWKKKEPRRTLS